MPVSIFETDSGIAFTLQFSVPGDLTVSIEKGEEMLVKLQNGSILSFTTIKNANPIAEVKAAFASANINATYILTFTLTKEQLEILSQSPITDLKINYSSNTWTYQVVEDKGKRIMEGVSCFKKQTTL
jgi:hypothetical protein